MFVRLAHISEARMSDDHLVSRRDEEPHYGEAPSISTRAGQSVKWADQGR